MFTGDQSLISWSDKQLCKVYHCLQVIRAWYPGLINNSVRFVMRRLRRLKGV